MVRYRHRRVNGKYVREHRIIMEAYLGRRLGPDEVVHHVNGDGRDNRIENLQVMDKCAHHVKHRREQTNFYRIPYTQNAQHGEDNPSAKVTAGDVVEIRRRVGSGERQTVLAAEYGLDKTAVYQMVHRKTWRHIV